MSYLNLQRAWFVLAGLLAVMMTLSSAVHAQDPQLKQIFTQLSATSLVRANFEQQKKLASLNKTFVSKGTILFSKSQGVIWKIQTPVKADLVVTQRKLVQKTQRTYSQIDMEKSPYGSVATMFLQLMSGDETALVKNFNIVSVHYTPAQWNVALTPKSSLFKKLFVRVDVQGQRYVDRIVLLEKANNSTTIRFSQQTTQPQTLMAEENALFQLAK